MKYILNSAVITSPGEYRYRLINADEARKWAEGGFLSTVGYEQTADALTQTTARRSGPGGPQDYHDAGR